MKKFLFVAIMALVVGVFSGCNGSYNTSEDYINGKELKIDYDKYTVNGVKYDNTTNKCWIWTMSIKTKGMESKLENYLWGTKFELMVACESAMYEASRNGVVAEYAFVEAVKSKQSEDACENANNDL